MKHRIIAWSLALLGASCDSDSESGTPLGSAAPIARLTLDRPTPLPTDLVADYRRARDFVERGYFTHATGLYQTLVEKLRQRWGPTDSKLVPYHYEYCLCLKSAGALDLVLEASAKALELWPSSFRHHVLLATTRMSQSVRRGGIVRGTAESVARVLTEEHHLLLRELKIEPADMHVQWANVLFRAQKVPAGLDEIEVALSLAPDSYRARHLKANCLVALERLDEAIPIIERLLAEQKPDRDAVAKRDLVLETLLASSYLKTGRAKEAWARVENSRAALEAGGLRSSRDREIDHTLRVCGASALNRLGRYSEARSLILPTLRETPYDPEAIQPLADTIRGLNLLETAEALERRIEELADYSHEVRGAKTARATGLEAQAALHDVRALLTLERLGEAQQLLREAIRKHPATAELHLLSAEIYLRLGRVGALTRTLDSVVKASRSHLIGLTLARLRARQGELEVAKHIVDAVENNLPSGSSDSDRLRGFALRARLEIGEHEKVLARVRSGIEPEIDTATPEIVILCRVENLLRDGELDSARAGLSQSFASLDGGESWAAVLRGVTAGLGSDDSSAREKSSWNDPSDFLDNPALIRRLRALGAVRSKPAVASMLDRAVEILERRNKLIERMKDQPDNSVTSIWREILELYVEAGAGRKAREVAWFLWNRDRGSLGTNLLLARTLSRPEEILERLAALERAARVTTESEETNTLLEKTRAELGLSP